MSVSYPLAFPTAGGVRDITIRHRKIVGVSRAPFSILSRQTYEWPGNEAWEADINLPPMTRANAAPWQAFLLSLNAQIGTFLMGDPNGATPLGAAASNQGTPQVDGSGQTGNQIYIKTGLGTVANWLLAGSWLQLGSGATSRLYKTVTDASLASDGRVTLDIRPALRSATVDSETITLTSAKGLWSLVEGTVEEAIDNANHHRAATIKAVEASFG